MFTTNKIHGKFSKFDIEVHLGIFKNYRMLYAIIWSNFSFSVKRCKLLQWVDVNKPL